jgi:hypothetical protein
MKRTIVLLSAICALGTAQAQTKTSNGFGFGIKAGANFSNPKVEVNNTELDTKTKVGLNAGVFMNIPMGSSLSVQPEVVYSSLGYKVNDDKVDLNYLTVPVLIKYNFAGSGFGIYAGPQIGFLASAKYKPSNGSNTDIHDNFKGTDVSLVFGPEFMIPNTPVVLSGRYQVGLKNVAEPAAGNPDIKNNGATVTLGFRF